MKIVITCLTALFLLISINASASDDSAKLNKFWHFFRQAILTGNTSEVATKTRFPFEVRGVSDNDRVQYFNRGKFPDILKQVTGQKVVVQSGMGIEWKTMLDVIKAKEDISAGDLMTSDIFTVELFQFELIKNQWFFTRAYLEESAR